MAERIDLSMSDPDLIPLIVQVMPFLACLHKFGCYYSFMKDLPGDLKRIMLGFSKSMKKCRKL